MSARALFYILNDADLLNDLLEELSEAGVKGGTIFDTNGMGRALAQRPDFGAITLKLSALLKPDLKSTKTLMFVLDEAKVQSTIEVIEKVVGSLDEPGTGIAFSFPIDFIKGLKL